MALIIPPGYLHATYELLATGDTEVMITTCGHEIDAASGATGEESAQDLFNSFALNIVPELNTHYSLVGVTTYVGNDGPAPFVYTSTGAAVAGSRSFPTVPQNTAYLIRKRTDAAGRRGRGRMYLPSVEEGAVDNVGTLTGVRVSELNSAFSDWYDFLTGGVGARLYPPVVLHRSEGIGDEPAPTPITMFSCDGRVATQRRRLRP